MSLKLKNLTQFQEKENFEGKKEKTLILNCDNCIDKINESIDYEKCFRCFFRNLYINRAQNISYINIKRFNNSIDKKSINKCLDYFKILSKLKKNLLKIESFHKKYCLYQDFNCKLFKKDEILVSLKPNDLFNPIFFYLSVKKKYSTLINSIIVDPICQKCSYKIMKTLELILSDLTDLNIIKDLTSFSKLDKHLENSHNFYKKFLSIDTPLINQDNNIQSNESIHTKRLIRIYKVGKYGLFDVHIYDVPFEYEKRYSIELLIDRNFENHYQNKMIRNVADNINLVDIDDKIPLEALIETYKAKAVEFISTKYSFNQLKVKKIAFLATLQKIKLLKLFPLLVDDNIEEIFLDAPIDRIYINHQEFGRCRTNIFFTMDEIDRIKTFLRLYSGKRLDYSNPSLKFVLKNKYFYCRFAVDIDPIHSNKFGMDIRKLNKNIFNIQDLLKVGTLNPMMAAFLYFCILRRINITVTGETDTGKTTLINALDLIVPKEFRKIYVEDITESLNQSAFERHQLKFKVDSIESMVEKKYSKQNQIKNLLHRTPDIIYLGEILTKEEAEAMFHCLAAGLRGFQTIHSKDLNSLINRFIYHFNIDGSCLNDLDIIVLMKKSHYGRKVISISEISNDPLNLNNLHNILFIFNPETLSWKIQSDLFNSIIIRKLKATEKLSNDNFNELLSIYQEIFLMLSRMNKLTNQELIEFFDKINYFSFKSYNALIDYWQNWKKNRSLNF